LIARAQNLLEVCKDAMAFVQACVNTQPGTIQLADMIHRLKKEIYKAEGIE